jgi:hypothetical protein
LIGYTNLIWGWGVRLYIKLILRNICHCPYILDEKEKEERFQKFWEWYREITRENDRSIVNQIKSNTKELFVKLIHLGEEIDEFKHRWIIQKFQKSIEYNTSIKSRFGKPWISRELIN